MITVIEQFQERLKSAQHLMRLQAGRVKGPNRIVRLLDRADNLQSTINWSPKPERPGIGEIGVGSKKMCRGH